MKTKKQHNLTIEEALLIQKNNLSFWKNVLDEHYYNILVETLEKEQSKKYINTGYDVIRGYEVDFIVLQLINNLCNISSGYMYKINLKKK